MSKDIYDKIGAILDIFKNHKWLVLLILSFFGSNAGQYFYHQHKQAQVVKEKTVINNVIEKIDYTKFNKIIDKRCNAIMLNHKKGRLH